MIIPMKKLSLLLYHREKESFLNSLQDLGVVHVVENPEINSRELETLQNNLKNADQVIRALKQISKSKKISVAQNKKGNAEEVIDNFRELEAKRESIEQKIVSLKKESSLLEPWGEFNPASVDRLKKAGITIRFFTLNAKKFDALKKDDLTLEVINRKEGSVYFVVLEREEPVTLDAEEIVLPQSSLEDVQKEIEELSGQKKECEQSMEKLLANQELLKLYMANQTGHEALESAQLSMEETAGGKALALIGWLPVEKEKKVTHFLDGYSAWFEFSEPLPDDDVPVKMKNGIFSKLFEPVTKIFALPEYFELDPTPFFAPFFAFFFGLCLADVGYGILLVVIGTLMMKKTSAAMKPLSILVIILGGMTIFAGLLLNTFFGHAIFSLGASKGYFVQGGWAAVLNPIETDKGTVFPAMAFATYIGVFQLMLGMFLKAINKLRNYGPMYMLHPLGDICTVIGITIYVTKINFINLADFSFGIVPIGPFLSGLPFSVSYIFIGIGLAFMFLFNNPAKGILPYFGGAGLWALYQFTTGIMGDVLSYLRLFALGLAGGLLGAAFNDIAFMFVLQENGTINYTNPLFLVTLIVLVLGHTINFGLAALGSFVHPLRLTFVEFYKNLEFKGGGRAYSPLGKS